MYIACVEYGSTNVKPSIDYIFRLCNCKTFLHQNFSSIHCMVRIYIFCYLICHLIYPHEVMHYCINSTHKFLIKLATNLQQC